MIAEESHPLIINDHHYDRFYIIKNVDIHAGFCALVLYALNGIRKAQELNAIPVIHFEKNNTPDFYDPEHGENIWEYFFEPVSPHTYSQVQDYITQGVVTSNQVYLPSAEEVMNAHHKEKGRLATFWAQETPVDKVKWMQNKRALGRKYIKSNIHVRTEIIEKAQDFVNLHFQENYVIGVHIRGTDFAYAGPTGIDKYFKEIDSLILTQKLDNCQIFVATDQQQYIDAFKQKYRQHFLSSDAIRSTSHIAPFRLSNVSSYKKGEDVLIDMLLLSKCHHLLKGAAATGEMALWFNNNDNITDFSLQSEFYKKPYSQLQTAYAKLNIGKKAPIALKTHRFRSKAIRVVQGSIIGRVLFKRFKFIRRILQH